MWTTANASVAISSWVYYEMLMHASKALCGEPHSLQGWCHAFEQCVSFALVHDILCVDISDGLLEFRTQN
jgi:predicted nucleic acid-binding protein